MGKKASILDVIDNNFSLERGKPLPLGVNLKREGINFALFSQHATAVTLILFYPGMDEPLAEFPLDSRFNRTGNIWHVFVRGLDPGIEYGYRAERMSDTEPEIFNYDRERILIDPYAKALIGAEQWGGGVAQAERRKDCSVANSSGLCFRRSIIVDNTFDWGFDQPLNIHLADTIIYELHVRGFTVHPTSGVPHPGTYRGIIEKIPYLKELGITAVELMPVNEFEENGNPSANPFTGEQLMNFWGYHPISFFAPKASYASENTKGNQVREFKEMVKALHAEGIEVILDMVFNHTAEGGEGGPIYSFKGIDNAVYYIIDPQTGNYHNYSGCGNTLNCNHPVVRDMVLDCLRYWVTEMHIDGFRFDLASILGRGQDGSVLPNPPLVERIALDPVLANTKLIAEAWDAAGLYQVGTFPHWGRWAEWNGKFRDTIRRFLRSEPGMISSLAACLCGSADLYQTSGREPYHSINFITCHDGFSLNDLVSYSHKDNVANGEDNRDGCNENFSWNCGYEGPTDDTEINILRMRQMKNFIAILLVSQGVPMITAGDECARTQQGNNNAYCHDNEISWLNWSCKEEYAELHRFFRLLITFRKNRPALRRRSYVSDEQDCFPPISWHGFSREKPDWNNESRSLGVLIPGASNDHDIFLIVNAHCEGHLFELPVSQHGKSWWRVLDTMLPSPHDCLEEGKELLLDNQDTYQTGPHSVVVLLGKK
ncbi:MAG: glycogen debranching protein GlgX [bacterium]